MKTVVCVKQAVDVPPFVEFDAAGKDVDSAFQEPDLNEADTYALEEALRLRDEAGDGEVVVVTAGTEIAEAALRTCLGMGADRAVRVGLPAAAAHDPVQVARALAVAVRAEEPRIVFCGVQSSDAAQQSTGPALAAALDLPCVSVVTKVETPDDAGVTLRREFEGGLAETVEVGLPAVITVQTGLNEPRYGTFKTMMKAKKAQIDVVEPGDLGRPASIVRRMYVPDAAGSSAEFIQGGPAEIAARIVTIVREAV